MRQKLTKSISVTDSSTRIEEIKGLYVGEQLFNEYRDNIRREINDLKTEYRWMRNILVGSIFVGILFALWAIVFNKPPTQTP